MSWSGPRRAGCNPKSFREAATRASPAGFERASRWSNMTRHSKKEWVTIHLAHAPERLGQMRRHLHRSGLAGADLLRCLRLGAPLGHVGISAAVSVGRA